MSVPTQSIRLSKPGEETDSISITKDCFENSNRNIPMFFELLRHIEIKIIMSRVCGIKTG